MTWAKYGAEFFDQCTDADLSDAAARTHAEAIAWLYRVDRDNVTDLTIPHKALRRFAGSDDWERAVKELVAVGFWRDDGGHYVLVHHATVVKQSLHAQRAKLDRDRRAQQKRRDRARTESSVSADVDADVNASVRYDTVSQSVSSGSYGKGEVQLQAVAPMRKGSEPEPELWPDVTEPGSVDRERPTCCECGQDLIDPGSVRAGICNRCRMMYDRDAA